MEIIDYILITYYSLGGIILLLFYVLLKKTLEEIYPIKFKELNKKS